MQEWKRRRPVRRFTQRGELSRRSTRTAFVAVARMLADGFTTHRGRRSAHLHFDRVNDVLRGRRGARLTAITNGGAIPDQFDYDVVLQPSETPIGTLNEDFAFESMPGDVFQLGNTSYRIQKVESGKVYVADAQRSAADDSVLARRGAGPHRRAFGFGRPLTRRPSTSGSTPPARRAQRSG